MANWINRCLHRISTVRIRNSLESLIIIGLLFAGYLILLRGLAYTGARFNPFVGVLSGSMEPGITRGDVIYVRKIDDPIRIGQIIAFNVHGVEARGVRIPVGHRVIQVHEKRDTGEIDVLTKGDNNRRDDRSFLYGHDQFWLHQSDLVGRAVWYIPYIGVPSIILFKIPIVKYLLAALGFFLIFWEGRG